MNKEITISPRQIAQAVENLLDEKEELQQRIEKSIEYIEENKLNGYKISEMLCGSEVVKLLEILKGEDNER